MKLVADTDGMRKTMTEKIYQQKIAQQGTCLHMCVHEYRCERFDRDERLYMSVYMHTYTQAWEHMYVFVGDGAQSEPEV